MTRLLQVILRASLVLGAGVVILGLGIHLTGAVAWRAWKADRARLGERLEWSQLIPPSINDEENFACDPFVAGSIKGPAREANLNKTFVKGLNSIRGDWRMGRPDDLSQFKDGSGSRTLDDVLKELGPLLARLDQATLRAKCRFRVDYTRGEIPALLGFRAAALALRTRGKLSLDHRDSGSALHDTCTLLRLARLMQSEPNLQTSLLVVSLTDSALQLVWEGHAMHAWDQKQLEVLQSEIQPLDVLASVHLALESARIWNIKSFESFADGKSIPGDSSPKEGDSERPGLLGRGWIYRNLLASDRYFADHALRTLDPRSHRVRPQYWQTPEQFQRELRFRPDLALARIGFPTMEAPVCRASRTQVGLDQALVACALERHRLDRGTYPKNLEELVPVYLGKMPFDPMSGAPMHYQLTAQGFTLYSIGWNQKDDGGRIEFSRDQPQEPDLYTGDWPWPSNLKQ